MGIAITDHALVRWLERTGAMDIVALKAALSASLDRAAEAADQFKSSNYLILADGLVYVVRDAVLVTVLPDDGGATHAHALLRRAPAEDAGKP